MHYKQQTLLFMIYICWALEYLHVFRPIELYFLNFSRQSLYYPTLSSKCYLDLSLDPVASDDLKQTTFLVNI